MVDWTDRVLAERNDLQEKFDKLSTFLLSDAYNELDSYHSRLLVIQQRTMSNYIDILNMRLIEP